MPIKPMLCASTKSYTTLFDGRTYLASTKLDGVRAISENAIAYSRTGKIMRNLHIQKLFKELPSNLILDGELLSCEVAIGKTFSDYSKDIMSIKEIPNITYHIFDLVNETMTAKQRYNELLKLKLPSWCKIVQQMEITDYFSMESLEKDALDNGYEGLILKGSMSLYKFGRGTLKEKCAIKVKRFDDAEATIIGFEEKYHNTNVKEQDELGFSKRASCLSGLVPAGTLGSLKVQLLNSDIVFRIGSGFNDEQRKEIWNNKDQYLNRIVKFKHFIAGALTLPRFPIFLGFRDSDDL